MGEPGDTLKATPLKISERLRMALWVRRSAATVTDEAVFNEKAAKQNHKVTDRKRQMIYSCSDRKTSGGQGFQNLEKVDVCRSDQVLISGISVRI